MAKDFPFGICFWSRRCVRYIDLRKQAHRRGHRFGWPFFLEELSPQRRRFRYSPCLFEFHRFRFFLVGNRLAKMRVNHLLQLGD